MLLIKFIKNLQDMSLLYGGDKTVVVVTVDGEEGKLGSITGRSGEVNEVIINIKPIHKEIQNGR